MAKYQELAIEKFTEGMIDEDQLSRVSYPEGACVEAENVVFMPTGALKKRDGYSKMNTTPWTTSNPITRVYAWTTTGSPGTNYALAFCCCAAAGSACVASVEVTGTTSNVATFNTLKITGASGTWIPVQDEPITVTSYAGSAVMTHWGATSTSPLFFWNGTTATANIVDMTTSSPSGARVVCAWGNFLFLGNVCSSADSVRRASRIYWNTASTINSWPSTQWIDLDADDGDEITAMFIYKNKLIVFKKYKMFQIHYVGGALMFQEERISAAIGCLGPNAYIDYGGTLYFIGAYTAYRWEGSGEPESISDKIQGQWDNMNMDVARTFDADSDESNWQIWFNVANGSSTSKNLIYAFDTRFKSWTRLRLTHDSHCLGGLDYGVTEAYAHRPLAYSTYSERISDAKQSQEGVLCIGGEGYLYSYGADDDDDTTAFTGYWLSRWLDFGLPHTNKRLLRVTSFVERLASDSDYNLHVDLYADWDTANVHVQKTASLFGSVDYPMVERRIDFTHQFRSIQLKIYTDGSAEPFTLHRLLIDWVAKGKTKVS